MKTDFEIQQDVIAELQWEPALEASQIGVSVNGGVVVLSGLVDNYYKKVLAEKATKKVSGVRAVAEEIEVRLSASGVRTDVEIAQAVLHTLKWNSSVDEEKINLKVEKGLVTLEGEADWNFQKVSAQKAVENLQGICGLVNNIKVKNKIVNSDIKQKIAHAFIRNAAIDSENIDVEVLEDVIILTGNVSSWAEKRDAERIAWASPGVTEVDNRIEIVNASSFINLD